jgi:hypothetical protein
MVLQPEDHQCSGQLERPKMLDAMNVPIGPLVFDHAAGLGRRRIAERLGVRRARCADGCADSLLGPS